MSKCQRDWTLGSGRSMLEKKSWASAWEARNFLGVWRQNHKKVVGRSLTWSHLFLESSLNLRTLLDTVKNFLYRTLENITNYQVNHLGSEHFRDRSLGSNEDQLWRCRRLSVFSFLAGEATLTFCLLGAGEVAAKDGLATLAFCFFSWSTFHAL